MEREFKRPSSKYYSNKKETSNELFEVERVLKKGVGVDNKVYYKIKWMGEPESKSTWEPLENLGSIDDLIQVYEEELFKKPRPANLFPVKVNYAKMYNKKIFLNVSWKKNSDGSVNPDDFVAYEELRETHPLLVINYFEENMLFGSSSIKAINGKLIAQSHENSS